MSLEQTEFDVIVLGTGLTESILASAFARAGKSVLHLDSNDFYGGDWAALGFRELLNFATGFEAEDIGTLDEDGDGALPIAFWRARRMAYATIEYEVLIQTRSPVLRDEHPPEITEEKVAGAQDMREEAEPKSDTLLIASEMYQDKASLETTVREYLISQFAETSSELQEAIDIESSRLSHIIKNHGNSHNVILDTDRIRTLASLLRESRQYSLELTPKLLSCQGDMIELLISSGVSKYLEFKLLEKVFVYEGNGEFDKVPCSKEDVFTSSTLDLIEKRKLMKFLMFALDPTTSPGLDVGYEDKPFPRFLSEKCKIVGKMQSAVLYAIALIDGEAERVTTLEGLMKTQNYLKSLGRYGNSAFLVALYGGGSEIAQGFCRVCAVFGGIYMLNHSIDGLVVDNASNRYVALEGGSGQSVRSDYLITTMDYLPVRYFSKEQMRERISRAIVIIDRNILEGDNIQVIFPPGTVGNEYPVSVLQLSNLTQACPKDKFVLYMSTRASADSPRQDLIGALSKLVHTNANDSTSDPSKPNQLFSLYYQQCTRKLRLTPPENVLVINDPDTSLDFKGAVIEAKTLFKKIYPDEEFLPPGNDFDDE